MSYTYWPDKYWYYLSIHITFTYTGLIWHNQCIYHIPLLSLNTSVIYMCLVRYTKNSFLFLMGGRAWSHYIAQVDIKLMILSLLLPECWHYKCVYHYVPPLKIHFLITVDHTIAYPLFCHRTDDLFLFLMSKIAIIFTTDFMKLCNYLSWLHI